MLHFVYVVRELILELLSEVVLAAPPQYSANRSIRKQHQKTSLDRGKLSRFFLELFEHLHVLCLNNMQRQQLKAPQRSEPKHPKTCFWGSKRSQNCKKSRSRSVPAAKWVRAGSRGEKRPQKITPPGLRLGILTTRWCTLQPEGVLYN